MCHKTQTNKQNRTRKYFFVVDINVSIYIYVYRSEENGFTLKKARSRRYPAETNAYNTDDLAFLANTATHAECLCGHRFLL